MKLTKIKNQYVVSPVKLSLADEMFIEKYHLTPIVIDEKLEYFIKKGKMKVIE